MQSLSAVKKLLPGILFLLLAAMAPLRPCVAVTVEEIYDDDAGKGFKDGTSLTQTEKNRISPSGNDAQTLGEARTKAFEYATSLLESTLTNSSTIRISAKFVIFSGQENPNNPDECRQTLTGRTSLASAGPRGYAYPGRRLDQGDVNRVGLGTAYPHALHEAIGGRNLNSQEADLAIFFSECVPFHYGFTGPVPARHVDFVRIALHEIMHGIGFLSQVGNDGSFPELSITAFSTVNGVTTSRQINIKSRTIYDEQLYSESHDDLLINLGNRERAAAIISGTGLLWEGTDGGRNSCSYGQRMTELKASSARSQDGKPRLHAPSAYRDGASVSHTHDNAEDIMEALYPFPQNMDLTLGMLKDIGWSVSADGFPPGCEPTGIGVRVTDSVTTEGGKEAMFEVRLESEPTENIVIPLTNSDPSEGTLSTPELVFTPQDWDMPREVTVRGVDDGLRDGTQGYLITLEDARSGDRFYSGFTPSPRIISLRNEDNEPPPPQLQPPQLQPPQPPPPQPPPPTVTVSFDSSSYSVSEGEAVTVGITLSADPERTVTIPIAVDEATTADSGEYSLSSTSVTFASGEISKNITLTAADDDADDDGKTVVLAFGTLPPRVSRGTQDSATVTILDNDDPDVSVQFASSAYSVTEGETVAVQITLSADPERTVTIPIAVDRATTAATEDYSLQSASVAFESGETSKDVTLTAADDDLDDDDESVELGFGTLPEGVSAGERDRTTITILDNDVAESGGGGCAIATETGHGVAAVNLLLIVTVLFSVLLRSSANQPCYGESR